jgi:hypothetical protein
MIIIKEIKQFLCQGFYIIVTHSNYSRLLKIEYFHKTPKWEEIFLKVPNRFPYSFSDE